MKPHKHAELIKAWADGATIEGKWSGRFWEVEVNPAWHEQVEYRIKPEPKPDVVRFFIIDDYAMWQTHDEKASLKLTLDGETGKLKSAEVLK